MSRYERFILIDDNEADNVYHEIMIERAGFTGEVLVFESGEDALAFFRTDSMQVSTCIFLDINMPGRNGFELLAALDPAPQVIFVTAYDEHALQAFQVNALDYVVKPIDPERLAAAIQKLPESHSADLPQREVLRETDQIFLKDGEKCWFVTLKDVRYFESEGNYVRVRFDDQKPLVLRSLNKLEEKLDPLVYFRASRKHMINLRWVDKIEPWFNGGLMVKLKSLDKNGEPESVEVSRRQAARFKDLLSL